MTNLIRPLIAGLLAVAAAAAAAADLPSQCTVNTALADQFPVKASPGNATLFTVDYFSTYKVVTVSDTASNLTDTYVLYMRNSVVPSSGIPAGAKFFQIPVAAIAVTGSTTVDFIYTLKADDLIVYAPRDFVLNPCVSARNFNDIPIGSDYFANVSAITNVDVIFDSDISKFAELRNASNVVIDNSASESGIVASADWIKFFSLFFNFEARAISYSSSVASNVNALETATGSLASKKCAWFTYLGYSYLPYTLPWEISRAKYLIGSDGAFEYANCVDLYGSLGFTDDNDFNTQFYQNQTFARAFICQLDYLFLDAYYIEAPNNEWGGDDLRSFLANYSSCPVISGKAVYNTDLLINSEAYTDFFESKLVEGALFVEDIVSIVHSDAVIPGFNLSTYQRQWMRNIYTENTTLVTPALCPYSQNGNVSVSNLPSSNLLSCRAQSTAQPPSSGHNLTPAFATAFAGLVLAITASL